MYPKAAVYFLSPPAAPSASPNVFKCIFQLFFSVSFSEPDLKKTYDPRIKISKTSGK